MRDWTAFRHDLHRHPELGFAVTRTADAVAAALAALGVEVHRGIGETGVVGVLRRGEGPAIALRADMDALPIGERGDHAHRSTIPGRMHACGHDGHTAILLAAAERIVADTRWAGTVVFVFQPAEEGTVAEERATHNGIPLRCGGEAMVRDGLFERFPVTRAYALHNWPALPLGTIAVRAGAMMAATDELDILVEGRGGHAAMPDEARDPVLAAAQIIVAVQSLVAREVPPAEAAVVSLTQLESLGSRACNVIPSAVRVRGTLRSLSAATRSLLHRRLTEIVTGVAAALGASATVRIDEGYPPTVNDPEAAARAARAAARVPGVHVRTDLPPSMGAEDFAFLAAAVPAAYVWLGQADAAHPARLHSPDYDFHDALLPLGARFFQEIVLEELAPPAAAGR